METLSPKEQEVVQLVAFGLSQDEIAAYLDKSRYTVDELIRRAKRKLELQKATELAAWYYTRNYGITLNLGDKLRKIVSASLLSLVLFSMSVEHQNMLRVLRPVRTATRTARARKGRRDEYDFEYDPYWEERYRA